MTMFHHDSRDLKVAVSEAATTMRKKLHEEIEKHKNDGEKTIEAVVAEIPRDRYRNMRETVFDVDPETHKLIVNYKEDEPEAVHSFALGKVCESVGVPKEFLGRLMQKDTWGQGLAVEVLNTHFKNQPQHQQRRMIRSVQKETRGFLSDSYARVHPGMLLETFVTECKKYGLLPYGGNAGSTKFIVRAVMDRVLEPIKDEVISIGVVLKESPYGDGATELSVFMQRMWCTNTAIATSELRKVHLGGKAPVDFEEANHAYQVQSKSLCAEVKKSLEQQLAPEYIKRLEDGIRSAHESKVNHTQFEAYLKRHLSKTEVEEVREKYRSTDITDLPAGDSWWRASNVLSWAANQTEDPDKAYDLQKMAGQVLTLGQRA